MSGKVLTIVGAGALALAMNTGEASALEYNEGTVTVDVLNVRSEPGDDKDVIGKASEGDVLDIIGSSNGWYKVKLSKGKEGWVNGKHLKLSGKKSDSDAITETLTTATSATIVTKGKVTGSNLNIRSGAGTEHSVVAKLQKNDTVDVVDSSNGWCKVKLSNGKTGWCSEEYIESVEVAKITLPAMANNIESKVLEDVKGLVNTPTLSIRGGIGLQYSIIGTLEGDSEINLLEEANGWYKVRLENGVEGWVDGDLVTIIEVVEATEIVEAMSVAKEVDATKKPEAQSNVNTTTPKQDVVSNNVNKPSSTEIDMSNVATDEGVDASKQDAIINLAMAQLNKPYVWGAEGPNSFDCSGFTSYVYKNSVGVSLPRVSKDQANFGVYVPKGSFQVGDLIYLDTSGAMNNVVSHVGIYIGNGQMIHASGSQTNPRYVMITKIDSGWYKDRVMGARRVI